MPKDRYSKQGAQLTPLQYLLSSRLAIGMGMFLSKHMPPSIGYAVGGIAAGLLNWLKPDAYWIAHNDVRQVVRPQVNEQSVRKMVDQTFRTAARNYYDLWRLVSQGPEAIRAAVHFLPKVWTHLEHALQRGKGVFIAGTHTGNFDLSVLALAAHGLEIQVLGLAAPPTGGFDLMDQMRAHAGVRLTSISLLALREAISRLRAGGIVLTGVDRPVGHTGKEETEVEFFGRPAPLPTGHVRLALKTDAAVLVASPYRDPHRGNMVSLSPPLEMIRTGDPDEDLRVNLRHVTTWLERFIRARPEQWAMFVPVWQEL